MHCELWPRHSSEDTIARASYFSEPITIAAPLAACKKHKAKLIVAKLDRLTRNVAFLLKLIDAGVEVLFCDLPELNGTMGRFVLIVMANVAELEARLPVNPRPPGLLLG
jgi:DNA invertase Pin-like site-specific DNA recombinase